MTKMFLTLCVVSMSLGLSLPAMATTQYKKGEPFKMTGTMTHFYGFDKSAEAVLWANAWQVCEDLSQGENNRLLLNRLSDVVITQENAKSIAQATFVCLPVGAAH